MDISIATVNECERTNCQSQLLEQTSTYEVNGKAFIVTPVFQKECAETLGSILYKLMKSETLA